MGGSVPSFHMYALMVWTGTTLTLSLVGKYMVPGGNEKIMPQNNRSNRRDLSPLNTNTSQKPNSFKSTMLGETQYRRHLS